MLALGWYANRFELISQKVTGQSESDHYVMQNVWMQRKLSRID